MEADFDDLRNKLVHEDLVELTVFVVMTEEAHETKDGDRRKVEVYES